MNKFFLNCFMLIIPFTTFGQVFDVDTIIFNGDSEKLINIVILGDGFTENEQDAYILASKNVSQHIFKLKPWNRYVNYFNVFAIKVISPESGVVHPVTAPDCPGDMPNFAANTYFNTTFDYFDIHRLVVPRSEGKIGQVLAMNFPNYDQVLVLSNTPYYGGSGGTVATSTIHVSSPDIMIHEVGHSFAKLADEYYAGDFYAAEKVNMTQNTDPATVRWQAWMNTSDVGIYQHCCGGQSEKWYRPHQNCKMRNLAAEFCPVCSEAIIETIHSKVDPIVAYFPEVDEIVVENQDVVFKLTHLLMPQPNTLKINWLLNGELIQDGGEELSLSPEDLDFGQSIVTVKVVDTTELLRVTNHEFYHTSEVSWVLEKEETSHVNVSNGTQMAYHLFPNPSTDILNIEVESSINQNVVIVLRSISGTDIEVQQVHTLSQGHNRVSVDVSQLESGAYTLELRNRSIQYTAKIQVIR